MPSYETKVALLLPAENLGIEMPSTNLGNRMICEATKRIIERLPVHFKPEEFTFLRKPNGEELDRINACDRAIFVGTNIFQPQAVGWRWRAQDLGQIKIPYSLYGVGYSGPLGRVPLRICRETTDLVEWSRGGSSIGVRDPQTVRWLKLFGVNSELVGCPVLAYPDTFTDISIGKNTPVLAIREILLHNPGEGPKQAQQDLIDWFFEKYPDGRSVVQSPEDLKLVHDRPIVSTFEEIIEELSRARFVVSTRLHAGMLALAFGRPVVFLAHDTRVASFCEMIGVKAYPLTSEGLRNALKAAQRIDRGDLSELKPAVERVRLLVRRLHEFLNEEITGSRENVMRHPSRALTALRRARARLLEWGPES